MTELPLEMIQRHVRTGESLIARQEALVNELERAGHDAVAAKARGTLAQLWETQRLHEEHLARLTAERGERAEADPSSRPSSRMRSSAG